MMPMERSVIKLDFQEEQDFENAFSTFSFFSISDKNSMMCTNAAHVQGEDKNFAIIVSDNEPTLENITKFLRFSPINVITHFDYTELVNEEYFFPKVDAILDCLAESCPNLRGLNVMFQGNSNGVFSYYFCKIVNYKNLKSFSIGMVLESSGLFERLIAYVAEEFLIINGNQIKNRNCDSYALFNWDETNHKPVRILELYECSFLNSLDLISLLNLFKEELNDIYIDIEFPNIFFTCLVNCQYIETLRINFKHEDSIISLMGIGNLKYLSDLTFNNLHITARPLVKELFKSKRMKKLLNVRFENCPCIDDNILKIISLKSVSLQTLEIISSSSNPGGEITLSDIGIMSILYNCQSLYRLELDNICGIDGYFLAFAGKAFPKLKYVNITSCSFKSRVCQDVYDEQFGGNCDSDSEEVNNNDLRAMYYNSN